MDVFVSALQIIVILSKIVSAYGHFTPGDACGYYARDCEDVRDLGFTKSGVYHVVPEGSSRGYDVYCDMDTEEGGWLVFQRRLNGSVDFYRGWNDYELGFGDLSGEHWLGNVPLHIFTSRSNYQLRIDLEDWDGNKSFANYQIFSIGSPLDVYWLEVAGYSGTAGDSLRVHSGHTFKTKDDYGGNTCAEILKGAWWFISCGGTTLNGEYNEFGSHILESNKDGRGITWEGWRGVHYSLKKSEMKIKRI